MKEKFGTILESLFSDFVKNFDCKGLREEEQFERFVAYSVLSKYYLADTIDKTLLEEVSIGGGNDWGIDTFAVIINNRIVSEKAEVDNLLEQNRFIDVKFVFVQTKTSRSFDVGELSKFQRGVCDVFRKINADEIPLPVANEDLTNYLQLVEYIYSQASHFKDGHNPEIVCYYVTAGNYNDDNNDFASCREQFTTKLKKMQLFRLSERMPYMYGAQDVIDAYKNTKKSDQVEIKVVNKLNLPDVEGVKEGYEFLLPFSEYKKVIMNDDGTLKDVFNDNIRAFQGDNSVNTAIADTLLAGDFALFTAMNNGITIVAKDIHIVGTKFLLKDYQIVNGCQTSHVLYNNRDLEGVNDLQLTIRVIASNEASIRDKIILGTNSQTAVKKEQMLALSKIQINIEDYYRAKLQPCKLYYERRSKQYKNDPSVPYSAVITIPVQIMAFVSMFLMEPHRVNGYYADVINFYSKINKEIFSDDYVVDLYYTSGLAYYKMMQMFNAGVIPQKFKRIRLHLLLAFRLISESQPLKELTSERKVRPYCESLNTILGNKSLCEETFTKASSIINRLASSTIRGGLNQDGNFTRQLIEACKQQLTYNNI